MATDPIAEQEFVAHLFAPLSGPDAELALHQVTLLWEACRTQMGMTRTIDGTSLPPDFPVDVHMPEGALAGLQDPAVNFQAIARREHDVLNVSLVMATPLAPPMRRNRVGAAVPPGWIEYSRWWQGLTAGGVSALLGGAAIYQAKSAEPEQADVRAALPEQEDDGEQWWTRKTAVDHFTVCEVTPGGDRALRRLVVLGRPDEDDRLSRFTWSSGDVLLPPLGRYLMHAAKLRYAARVRGDGSRLDRVRDRAATRMDRIVELLTVGDSLADEANGLAADEAAVIGTLQALNSMRRSVDIARENMTSAMAEPLPTDRALASALTQWLDDDVYFLEQVRIRAERTRQLLPTSVDPAPPRSAIVVPSAQPAPAQPITMEQRMSFGVDVVAYTGRTVLQQIEVQRRLAKIVRRVLEDIGLALHDTDHQDAGDGMTVVLPAHIRPHLALPKLLNGWSALVAADNAMHPEDRIRLRLSVAAGSFHAAAIGITGATIIEITRLLDSEALRRAVTDHSDADLVALISDRLHADVIAEGHPGLNPGHFTQLRVRATSYDGQAWLWLGGPVPPRTPEKPPDLPSPHAPWDEPKRDLFVIHGDAERARKALFDLLRDIRLRPLEWDDLVAQTGSVAPERSAVLRQAFANHTAALVLFAPGPGGSPDVLAGMAFALQPDRTVLVRLGGAVLPDELSGRIAVHLDGASSRGPHQLAQLLRRLGYAVKTDGTDWLDTDRFKDF
ncbi:BN6_48550 family protein [Micromonospora sp. WMMC264]|uniref:CATRA conflict system CASPASE/TPR repeat-associated protein n=1 Tax=Micromonospora sp. WMMC264 TaxID=3015158 RepID=UPI00248C81C8|nr:CATRA conflict system CASPASE/TPR repeat-associated protein [Micromonospora sp. WMMC264]WBB88180.1 BN6_48550 family protein [Micromonospora sp. WMMC264]